MTLSSFFRLSLITLLIFQVGCSRQYSKPEIHPDDRGFKGILQHSSSRLVFIHGMCHHSKKWFESTIKETLETYGLEKHQERISKISPDSSPVELYHVSLKGQGREIDAFGIIYSPVTVKAKRDRLCYDMSKDRGEVCLEENMRPVNERRNRALLNARGKDVFLNDCLADAVIYLGSAGKEVRKGIAEALQLIAQFPGDGRLSDLSDSPLFFISESLGSKVLADTLVCHPDIYRNNAIQQLVGSTTQIFMYANQIPILNAGHIPTDCMTSATLLGTLDQDEKEQSDSTFYHFLNFINEQRMKAKSAANEQFEKLPVIAFTDPNDLLSYELRETDLPDDFLHHNVIQSNAVTVFGLFENPLPAHTAYGINKEVAKLVACGYQVQADEETLDCPEP